MIKRIIQRIGYEDFVACALSILERYDEAYTTFQQTLHSIHKRRMKGSHTRDGISSQKSNIGSSDTPKGEETNWLQLDFHSQKKVFRIPKVVQVYSARQD